MSGGKEIKVVSRAKHAHAPISEDAEARVISYVIHQQWKGFTNAYILEALRKAGWPQAIIDEAFDEANRHPMHTYRKRIAIGLSAFAAVVATVFVLSSSAIYFVIENIMYIVVGIGAGSIGFIVFLYYRRQNQQKGKVVDEAPKRTLDVKPGQYETDIDLLYKILLQKKKMRLSEIMSDFGVNEKHAKEWVKILEQHGLAKVKYPAFGEAEVAVI